MMRVSRLTYMGRSPHRGKLGYLYLLEDGTTGVTLKPVRPAQSVGQVIAVSHPDEGASFITSGQDAPRVVGVHPDPKEIQAWSASSLAYSQMKADEDASKRLLAQMDNPVNQAIEILKESTKNLNTTQRAALLRYVTAAVCS